MSERRRLRSPSTSIPIFRILSLMVMLAVIGLTIYNLRPRGVTPVLVSGEQQDAQPIENNVRHAEKATATLPKNRKPIADEDPQEFKQFRRESEAVLDKATVIRSFELPAYWHILNWLQMQSLADLKGRSFPEVAFKDFMYKPDKFRGRPVRVELLIRRVLSFEIEGNGKGSKPKKLYELWGWPTASDGWLYVIVTPELPPGFPVGKDIEVTTTVYGYFFKLQGYQPADAKPNARPLAAPLLMGRVAPVSVAADPPPQNPLNDVLLIIGGMFLVAMVVSWVIAARRKPISRFEPTLTWPDLTDEVEHD